MLGGDVAARPASVYRMLKAAGRLDRNLAAPSKKGTGFVQPLTLHEHSHVDISSINVDGTFCCLISVLDSCGRYIPMANSGR